MQLVEGSVPFLMVPFPCCGLPLLGYLFAWTLVLAPCFFYSPFVSFFLQCFLLIKFGRVSSSFWSGPGRLVSLKFGDEIYAEQNVKHPPMTIEGVSVTSYYTAPTWFCTHMVLPLGSAYVSSNLKIILREFEVRFEPVWGQFSVFWRTSRVVSFLLLLLLFFGGTSG
jgi:hypothetical protein